MKIYLTSSIASYFAAPLIFLLGLTASGQNLTLPVYALTVESAYLDSLAANPASLIAYPAELEYEGEIYPCDIRYRGATALTLPKKSWKIIFEDEGPLDREETNLNAEYRDVSICRNYLGMELSRYAGLPTPDTRFISLIINGEYYGVYHEIEQVDANFFDRRDLGEGDLFKAVSHGARFALPIYSHHLTKYNEIRINPGHAVDTLGARFAFIQNASPAEIVNHIDELVDAENILDYFAVQYCIANHDGFSKNFYIHLCNDGLYRLVAWDMDATFGNNWQGTYIGLETWLTWNQLNHQAIFQRLISIPAYHQYYLDQVHDLATEGFEYIEESLEDAYDLIRNDVYQDTLKKGSNSEFDDEEEVLEEFLELRGEHLATLDYFNRAEIAEGNATPCYLNSPADPILFTARVFEPVYSVGVRVIDEEGETEYHSLNDNGSNGDMLAGDLVYSGQFVITECDPPYFYCFETKANSCEAYPTPPSGWFDFDRDPLSLPSIEVDDNPPQPDDISIDCFFFEPISGNHYFALINHSSRNVNLSGCILRLGQGHRFIRLPPQNSLSPTDSIFITNHLDWLESFKPDANIKGGFYFFPDSGDTVLLETPGGAPLAMKIVVNVGTAPEYLGSVVINEINYHSADDFDPGDWLELYCRTSNHNLNGWKIYDCRDDHCYTIPSGVFISEGEYLVIAKDPTTFSELFPGVDNVIGGFGFSWGAAGEEIRLFDSSGTLIDWVRYDDEAPWPEEPDGEGPTLELLNPWVANFSAENWRASSMEEALHGTPGSANSVMVEAPPDIPPPIPVEWQINSIYPNPFNSMTCIRFTAPTQGVAQLAIYDIMGRSVRELQKTVTAFGSYEFTWDGRNHNHTPVASGLYFLQLKNASHRSYRKLVLLK